MKCCKKETYINEHGNKCYRVTFATAQQVNALTEDQIKSILGTGVCISEDGKHIVLYYDLADKRYPAMKSGDVLYIVSDYEVDAIVMRADTGERITTDEAKALGVPCSVGYTIPGPFVDCRGKISIEAGNILWGYNNLADTKWTGCGYVHEPKRSEGNAPCDCD